MHNAQCIKKNNDTVSWDRRTASCALSVLPVFVVWCPSEPRRGDVSVTPHGSVGWAGTCPEMGGRCECQCSVRYVVGHAAHVEPARGAAAVRAGACMAAGASRLARCPARRSAAGVGGCPARCLSPAAIALLHDTVGTRLTPPGLCAGSNSSLVVIRK